MLAVRRLVLKPASFYECIKSSRANVKMGRDGGEETGSEMALLEGWG